MHHCACMWRQWVWVVREGEVQRGSVGVCRDVRNIHWNRIGVQYRVKVWQGEWILEHMKHMVHCSKLTRRFDPNRTFLSCTKPNHVRLYVCMNVCTYVSTYQCSSYTAWVSGCYSTSSVKSTHFLACTQHTWSGVTSLPIHSWPLDQTHTLWLYESLEALQVGVMCVTPVLTVLTLSVLCRILMRCPR